MFSKAAWLQYSTHEITSLITCRSNCPTRSHQMLPELRQELHQVCRTLISKQSLPLVLTASSNSDMKPVSRGQETTTLTVILLIVKRTAQFKPYCRSFYCSGFWIDPNIVLLYCYRHCSDIDGISHTSWILWSLMW